MREQLPSRRVSEIHTVEHLVVSGIGSIDKIELILAVGRYSDGRLAEVFIDLPWSQRKTANAMLGKDAATLISIAIQSGVDLKTLAEAMGGQETNIMGKMVEVPHTIIGTVLRHLVSLE